MALNFCNQSRSGPQKNNILETPNMSQWISMGKILPTSPKTKEDVFNSFRPIKPCVDYRISETSAKMRKGDVKINIRQTVASYHDIPPEICKSNRKKKIKMFSGRPPQFKFVDELWGQYVEAKQEQVKNQCKKLKRKLQHHRAAMHKNLHSLVQEIVGPEWFMELSPKQLMSIDDLRQAVFCDICKGTSACCEQVLSDLGVILKPNRQNIKIALNHSCGDPVEFLLVLYQNIDPKRTSYSLNDRLLLSAVTHLTIISTLRELHVRIPSPPRISSERKITSLKKKMCKASSPYLQPLKYEPPPPRFSGVYFNKHRQYPENSYFAYISILNEERKVPEQIGNYSSKPCNAAVPVDKTDDEILQYMKEYKAASHYYERLPGAKKVLAHLLPPKILKTCSNMLPIVSPAYIRFAVPHLLKVTSSEEVSCLCNVDSEEKPVLSETKVKSSVCEKAAQDYLSSLRYCDECIQHVQQQNLIRIHGGFQIAGCSCHDRVPIVQGTIQIAVCDCFKEYRDKIVGSTARQKLIDQPSTYVLGGVSMTKFGPTYNITAAKGRMICLCREQRQRKAQIKNCKQILLSNVTKFVINGVSTTRTGIVYSIVSVVARKPCQCIIKYRSRLEVLKTQNNIRQYPVMLINNGLVCGKFGPVFNILGVLSNPVPYKYEEMPQITSETIEKPMCFKRCMDYLNYQEESISPRSNSSHLTSASTGSQSSRKESSLDDSSVSEKLCWPCCPGQSSNRSAYLTTKQRARRSCGQKKSEESTYPSLLSSSCGDCPTHSSVTTSSTTGPDSTKSDQQHKSASGSGDDGQLNQTNCTCKDELAKFMVSKCPCEECNMKIRRSFAMHILGGTKVTPSGNQINIVQGIQQPVCGCLHDHLDAIRKVDDYKARIKARLSMMKQPKKYYLSGVRNTSQGPVYIISGLRPSVECECGKAMREKEEIQLYEEQRAKPPNTGRQKYGIQGVKAMPERNIYIMNSALQTKPCECEALLTKFEKAHKGCLDEYEKYLVYTENEKAEFFNDMTGDYGRQTFLQSVDLNFAQGFGNFGITMAVEEKDKIKALLEEIQDTKKIEGPSTPQSSFLRNIKPAIEIVPNTQNEDSGVKMPITPAGDEFNACSEDKSSQSNGSTSESSSESSDEEIGSAIGSCHADNPPKVRPITIPEEEKLPKSFESKRFAIFQRLPKSKTSWIKIIRQILDGMADDGFPLAKLPQVEKLPVLQLWIELRIKTYWMYPDKVHSYGKSKSLWKHTDLCYKPPRPTKMPYSIAKANTMTWRNAEEIKAAAVEQSEKFYRNVKQLTIETGREFFATTFSYKFPTHNWRECAFSYLPTKENNLFPYKIVQPHDTRIVPENKKTICYC